LLGASPARFIGYYFAKDRNASWNTFRTSKNVETLR
ncbi:hypothetical protein MGSAQ_002934, partial [marine sediment metagenome]